MAGLGRKVFAPGEVLTATNVQNYLMDQAVQVYAGTAARGSAIGSATTEGMVAYLADVNSMQMATGTATWVNVDSLPIVSGTATRNALYPSPVAGNTVFRSDTGVAETYYSAYSTAVPGGRDSAGWYATTRVDGLVPVQPTSVAVAGGTATANALGLVSFTTATSISLNGVFTSAYNSYRMLIRVPTTSTLGTLNFRFRNAGTDNTTSNYVQTWLLNRSTGATQTNNGTNTQGAILSWAGAETNAAVMWIGDVMNPAVVGRKNLFGKGALSDPTSFAIVDSSVMFQLNTLSFDGFTIYPTAGNITGTVQILGYNA
jgi:hypothetical protein